MDAAERRLLLHLLAKAGAVSPVAHAPYRIYARKTRKTDRRGRPQQGSGENRGRCFGRGHCRQDHSRQEQARRRTCTAGSIKAPPCAKHCVPRSTPPTGRARARLPRAAIAPPGRAASAAQGLQAQAASHPCQRQAAAQTVFPELRHASRSGADVRPPLS